MTAAEAVRAACIAVTGAPIAADAPLDDVVDSLARVEIVAEIEEALGVEMPMDVEFEVETVADLVDAVEQAMVKR